MRKEEFKNYINESTININGDIVKPEEAKISIFDRGFLYGDSIYEVLHSTQRRIVFLDDHISRLYHSANLLSMNIYYQQQDIIEQIMKTLKASNLDEAYIRIILTRGESILSLDPTKSFTNNFVIIVRPRLIPPKKFYNEGMNLYIPHIIRNDIKAVNPNAKSGNYLNNVMALSEARKYGADDAVMINQNNEVTEGTNFNIWMIKDNIVYTPPVSTGLLKGITRQKIIDICQEKNIELSLSAFQKEDLLKAQEVFITSSSRGIMPVKQINQVIYGENISSWPLTKKLMQHYHKKVAEEYHLNHNKY
ncbi:MAG: branched-chain-amino acid aminotransferase [Halobacteriovoraceae bacterium]|jgi:branched-chain amino acid aminotransferase|nr:branched-chain-amino acid aminotransferase [Halobacteriovoraceae bacterium]